MKKKIGIIGYGWVAGANHRSSYSLAKDAEIVAVCDVKPEARARAKEHFGLSDDCIFDDYKKLIDSALQRRDRSSHSPRYPRSSRLHRSMERAYDRSKRHDHRSRLYSHHLFRNLYG